MKKRFLHLHFNDLTHEELVNAIKEDIIAKKRINVCTPNLDFLRNSYKNCDVRRAYNQSNYITIDGKIVYLLSKFYRSKIKNKFSGSDMAEPILEMLNENGLSVFFFGGKDGVAQKAAENVLKKYPNLNIKGSYCPKFGFEKDDEETQKVIEVLNEAQADLIFFCCGSPKSELFYFKNKELLPNACYLCIGATIDFLAGNIKRAPKWMSKCGLEWLYRLNKDFKRLFKRYLLDFFFLNKIFWVMLFNRKKFKKKYEESLM